MKKTSLLQVLGLLFFTAVQINASEITDSLYSDRIVNLKNRLQAFHKVTSERVVPVKNNSDSKTLICFENKFNESFKKDNFYELEEDPNASMVVLFRDEEFFAEKEKKQSHKANKSNNSLKSVISSAEAQSLLSEATKEVESDSCEDFTETAKRIRAAMKEAGLLPRLAVAR